MAGRGEQVRAAVIAFIVVKLLTKQLHNQTVTAARLHNQVVTVDANWKVRCPRFRDELVIFRAVFKWPSPFKCLAM